MWLLFVGTAYKHFEPILRWNQRHLAQCRKEFVTYAARSLLSVERRKRQVQRIT